MLSLVQHCFIASFPALFFLPSSLSLLFLACHTPPSHRSHHTMSSATAPTSDQSADTSTAVDTNSLPSYPLGTRRPRGRPRKYPTNPTPPNTPPKKRAADSTPAAPDPKRQASTGDLAQYAGVSNHDRTVSTEQSSEQHQPPTAAAVPDASSTTTTSTPQVTTPIKRGRGRPRKDGTPNRSSTTTTTTTTALSSPKSRTTPTPTTPRKQARQPTLRSLLDPLASGSKQARLSGDDPDKGVNSTHAGTGSAEAILVDDDDGDDDDDDDDENDERHDIDDNIDDDVLPTAIDPILPHVMPLDSAITRIPINAAHEFFPASTEPIELTWQNGDSDGDAATVQLQLFQGIVHDARDLILNSGGRVNTIAWAPRYRSQVASMQEPATTTTSTPSSTSTATTAESTPTTATATTTTATTTLPTSTPTAPCTTLTTPPPPPPTTESSTSTASATQPLMNYLAVGINNSTNRCHLLGKAYRYKNMLQLWDVGTHLGRYVRTFTI
jgi:hypothetical protein